MSKRIILILFCISMAFNIAFVSAFFYHSRKVGALPPFVSCRRQPSRIREFHEQRKSELKPLADEYFHHKKKFISMLAAEEFDEQLLQKELDQCVDKQMIMERKLGEAMIEFRKELTPEEAHEFFTEFIKRATRFKRKAPPHINRQED